MAFDESLANRVREFLAEIPSLNLEEKKMFGGLAFMVNGKMCVNVSGNRLMCRFHPDREEEVQSKLGYEPMNMRGKLLKGYCYVQPEGFKGIEDFIYWMNLCLAFNQEAKESK